MNVRAKPIENCRREEQMKLRLDPCQLSALIVYRDHREQGLIQALIRLAGLRYGCLAKDASLMIRQLMRCSVKASDKSPLASRGRREGGGRRRAEGPSRANHPSHECNPLMALPPPSSSFIYFSRSITKGSSQLSRPRCRVSGELYTCELFPRVAGQFTFLFRLKEPKTIVYTSTLEKKNSKDQPTSHPYPRGFLQDHGGNNPMRQLLGISLTGDLAVRP